MAKKPIPNKPGVSNWVERAGHLPPMIRRIAEHLHGQGKDVGHSIAIAVNAVKKGCATGDLNWPGKQSMNPASRAEYCAAASQWEAMKARSASAARPEGEIMEFHDGLYTPKSSTMLPRSRQPSRQERLRSARRSSGSTTRASTPSRL